jgi:putative hydrolase of the HAD superfamily
VLDCLVFDCDDTLYPRGSGLMQAISARISQYMIERMGMDPEIVPDLRREYWIEYGTTSRGLQVLHEFDVEDYMHYVHDLPLEEYIRPDPTFDEVLTALPQRKVIFTNATAEHARAVLDVVGVGHHFTEVYDAFFLQNEGKPALRGYQRLLESLGEEGKHCLFAEDSARNLRPAKELGMVTVLVDPPPGDDVDGVDYVIERIADIGQVVERVRCVDAEA